MRIHALLPLALIFLAACGSCGDGDSFSRICPAPRDCALHDDGSPFVDKLNIKGTCRPGVSSHDPTNDCKLRCTGYTGPVEEICGDQLDNDCDGDTDEGFDKDGDGFKTCEGDCDDDDDLVFPGQIEICNNVDDNCDEQFDENLSQGCWTGDPAASLGPPSHCRAGTSTCTTGLWGNCYDQVPPLPHESCNYLDDDCDGLVDETEPDFCGPSVVQGICIRGDQVCDGQGESFCVGAVYETTEVCNGADDDCDGDVDENIERACRTECGTGIEECYNGGWRACDALIPDVEICDGIDNDCDGTIDEDCPCRENQTQVCTANIVCGPVTTGPCAGVPAGTLVNCGIGVAFCDLQGQWGPCEFFTINSEACNNWDDDCDGSIDGMSQACGNQTTAGIGICQLGTSTCTDGLWEPCDGDIGPENEICDGLDNDCDNEIDEDLNPHEKVDVFFLIDGSGSMCSKAIALEQGIAPYVADFINTDHYFGLGVYPARNAPIGSVDVLIPPVDVVTFLATLALYACNYPDTEPGWDATFHTTDSTDPFMIGWRVATGTISGAYPYIIVITDESANQGIFTESDVAAHTNNCAVGVCVPGDRWEIYVITSVGFWGQWDEPTFYEPARILNMFPVDAQRYTNLLRGIFTNVCL